LFTSPKAVIDNGPGRFQIPRHQDRRFRPALSPQDFIDRTSPHNPAPDRLIAQANAQKTPVAMARLNWTGSQHYQLERRTHNHSILEGRRLRA
jgi:hypothetical protein